MLAALKSFPYWNDVLGNVSYVLMGLSFFVTRMLWLRLLATVSMLIEIVYFLNTGGDLLTSIGWDAAFIAINCWRILALLRDQAQLRSIVDLQLLRETFPNLDDQQISAILKAGEWQHLPDGAILAREGEPVPALYLICEGVAEVSIAGNGLAELQRGDLVGEVGYITSEAATATVAAKGAVRVMAIDKHRLRSTLRSDHKLEAVVNGAIGGSLARKLAIANRRANGAMG